MDQPDQVRLDLANEPALGEPRGGRACLVAGCPCKDARIVSHRRAAFFAVVARRAGETADRVIVPDPGWTLPAATFA